MLARTTGLTNPETANYEVSAVASGACALITTASLFEGNYVSFYLSLATTAYLATAAVRQYGLEKSKAWAGNVATSVKDTAVNQYYSFFPAKTEAKKPVELSQPVEEAKPVARKK